VVVTAVVAGLVSDVVVSTDGDVGDTVVSGAVVGVADTAPSDE
jgi:hypothetical protein